jgi:hypothetical protein
MLNEQQQEAKHLIENYIKNPKGTFGLLGAGGTGKTYLITSLKDSDKFLFLAPTNKAVNVLRKGLKKNGSLKPNVKTIDSYFSFKKIMDEENKPNYSYSTPPSEKIHNVIIVDEVSMLKDKHVDLLLSITKEKALILLGDTMQIPPVIGDGSDDKPIRDSKGFLTSKSFTVIDNSYTLTKQNRQNIESDLFKLINGFRDNMHLKLDYNSIAKRKNNDVDILFMNQNDPELDDFIKNNNTVCVSYKNETTDLFNYKIGSVKSNNNNYNIKKINIGDDVIFHKFYRNDKTTYYTSEQVNISNIYEKEITLNIPYYEKPLIDFITVADCKGEIGFTKQIWLKNTKLREKVYSRIYAKRVSFKRDLITGDFEAKNRRIKLNTVYSDFMNGFADLKKPYAMTSHKSQGSTYENVIIPIYDFYIKHHQDRNQLFYVAMSRASEKIIFVDGICNFGKTYWRVNFTQEEKYLIAGTQNFKCNICNCDLNDGKFDIDHKHRLGYRNEKGELKGNNQIENLQALCKECHKEKTKTDKI